MRQTSQTISKIQAVLQPGFYRPILKEVRQRASLVYFTVDWQARARLLQQPGLKQQRRQRKTFENLGARFEKHVAPKVNHRLARYQLQQFKQTET